MPSCIDADGQGGIHCAREVVRLDGVKVPDRDKWCPKNSNMPEGMVEERVACCDAVMKKPWRRALAVEGTAAARSPTDVASRRLFRVTGIAGLAATVVIFVAVMVGTRTEPTFDATAAEVLAYYRSPNTPGADFRSFVLTVGLIAFVWFVVALTTLLRRAEGGLPWRSYLRRFCELCGSPREGAASRAM